MHIRMRAQKNAGLFFIKNDMIEQSDAELVCDVVRESDSMLSILIVLQKYFLRTGGYISLTVLLTEQGEEQYADIVASGSGNELKLSLGAHADFIKTVMKALESCGFATEQ